jgi:hypothetical protein
MPPITTWPRSPIRPFDLLARSIRLEPGTTKNRDNREVTMTRSVHALLSTCAEGKKPEDYVFHS